MIKCVFCKADLPSQLTQFGHQLTAVCGSCFLSKGVTCPFCEDGHVVCRACDGEGWFFTAKDYSDVVEFICGDCAGHGFLYCGECEGSGMITAEMLPTLSPEQLAQMHEAWKEDRSAETRLAILEGTRVNPHD